MRKTLLLVLASVVLLGACVAVSQGNQMRNSPESHPEHPPTGPVIAVDNVQVHAHIQGSGPDLVLLHGAGGNTRDFTFSMVEKLSDRYRVIAFDRPGHGYTGRIPDREFLGETPQEQADLLAAAARELGVKDPILLGHSFGGAVALSWVLDHPDLAKGLVMVAAVSNPWEGGLAQWYQTTNSWFGRTILLPVLSAAASDARIARTIEEIFEPDAPPRGYMDHIGVGLSKSVTTLRATTQQVNGLKPQVIKMQTRYDEIGIPVEIVHGTADETVPIDVHSRPLSGQVDGANLVELPGVGHMPHHVEEQVIIDAIDRAAKRAGLR